MALADFAPADPSTKSRLAATFHSVVRWVAAQHEKRAQDQALQSLLFAPEHRLRDVGITRDELFRAIEARRKI
jgi:uncharacterized protein YjiS (DUF1127 family)